ncbi:L-A virus GAG protein N-acetyltransferase, putative [Brugia malayi]|uniref:N-terminal methionine N(alpha)-acetyltransferase NatC n=1 Tax=Brugia malayi TaxID=6279 RepID=A0A0K0J2S1_BRUMA|nr:L-A virus GAG protein N-acetyltransferase, putative [Brugia malayi]CDQ04224.1 Bm1718, isoform b [Brugia malayi]VIO99587.1 L-A virus GAG protein N-acetyltransferase, putative [Brugia malayi]
MEKGVEICPHPNSNSNSVEVLDEAILTLKRCLTLTNESSSGKCVEEIDEIKKERIEGEEIDTEQVDEISSTQVTQCTMEDCTQNGSVAEAESQTVVSSIKIRRIHIVEYENEYQMADIMRLITKVLSEPYSIYTYRYFIHNWPKLCLLALDENDDKYVGAIVCKLDLSRENRRRGYIAMLAVDESCRKMGIGTRLVQKAISNMQEMGCDQVVLETEVTNSDALRLYSNLGFIREKRLFRYYLNGVDAYRLKLFLTTINESLLLDPPMFLGSTQCVP